MASRMGSSWNIIFLNTNLRQTRASAGRGRLRLIVIHINLPFNNENARKEFIFTEFNRDRSAGDELVEILRHSDQEEAATALMQYNQSKPSRAHWPEVRTRFMQNMDQFLPLVTLSPLFMTLLEKHTCAHNLIRTLQGITDITAKKVFIFTEFNRDRNACYELVDFLRKSDQPDAARELELYIWWTAPLVYSQDVRLTVKNANTLRSGASRWFVMDGYPPRGRVIVFLQLDELKKEAERFDHIFQQLYFSVDIHVNYSCDQILDTLKLASQQEFKKDAIIVMFIGHGHNELIQGSGQGQDEIHIKTLVDQFYERNCHATYRPKPKIFIFSCCQTNDIRNVQHSVEWDWMDGTTRTFILYAWAKGIHAIDANGYTLFGQTFSHYIAEYAWDLNLTQIFNKTADELSKADETQRPELIMKTVDRDLYFNPGLYKEK
ncbi:unnamed protein product [Oppiella nova]|uniref:Caspase family p20 domain-containing protein n=1 Tax=Oppiella nova TaxID=334625 RepID=A0A7R9LWZ3_9ACAR|nr:unnamed protein product [Oppiella nova]CAG2167708.1 unnamed protein product [Oppiella nova]